LDLAVYPADLSAAPDRQRLYLVRSELFAASGASIWRVSYDDVEPVTGATAGLLLPQRVHIEQAGSSSDTLVHFKQMTLNPQLSDDAFVQTARPGMREEEASCE
jgi:hypothetical protein